MSDESDEDRRATVLVDKSHLYEPLGSWSGDHWPIVYHPMYNIRFWGLERCHPFDAGKWGRVHDLLRQWKLLAENDRCLRPNEASGDDLLVVHTPRYLRSLRWSAVVAAVTELPPVACLPNCVVDRKALRPFRFHTGGTILAAKAALRFGWAINLGGGFHHCSANRGGGFCTYADISLALRFLLLKNLVRRVLLVDLDAHQGNGPERDFSDDNRVYILDVYNAGIYPRDVRAKRGISKRVELASGTQTEEYLSRLHDALSEAMAECGTLDLLFYNAGTDCLEGDPLGALCLSSEGVIARDEFVFSSARQRPKPIPVVMVTSGGYQRNNAEIIAKSILNLQRRGLISKPQPQVT